jgi:hypothetical protein
MPADGCFNAFYPSPRGKVAGSLLGLMIYGYHGCHQAPRRQARDHRLDPGGGAKEKPCSLHEKARAA